MTAYIGIGSNLADPVAQVRQAVLALGRLSQSRSIACSSLYRSKPWGLPGQPDYINAVAALETTLPALELLTQLQALETARGRVRTVRWGPRTLDLDILLYGELQFDEPRLIVPHPRLRERAFVLYPLHDLAPELRLPDGMTLATLLAQCPPWELERVAESELQSFWQKNQEAPNKT
ncbi:MAG TPA: 2-amino-4-hydroxy-6-hydroxymethyldihydropteridine diphosphokinase [Candidatus Competibacteraceae bacterium]|nr:2-amino-4-hydroxy-6-hydroxymethyldihydropteridine diphosphokinase [Candidatus Competibacteraceae bacterium]